MSPFSRLQGTRTHCPAREPVDCVTDAYSFRRTGVVVADRMDPDDLAVDEALEPSRHPPLGDPADEPAKSSGVDNGRTTELRH